VLLGKTDFAQCTNNPRCLSTISLFPPNLSLPSLFCRYYYCNPSLLNHFKRSTTPFLPFYSSPLTSFELFFFCSFVFFFLFFFFCIRVLVKILFFVWVLFKMTALIPSLPLSLRVIIGEKHKKRRIFCDCMIFLAYFVVRLTYCYY
jgi:hypothetical protein